jgi:hypothetical protein
MAPAQAVSPFLYPPYPGSASQNSIFDHTSPNYSTSDNQIVTYGGHRARKNCPSPPPAGTPPPGGICDSGYGIYWSYTVGDWVAYNGHDGIDYGISYRPVYAAADADQVMYSGWWDPQNHSSSYGIYVRLHHANGYRTVYGHMSSTAVQSCLSPGCAFIPHGEMIGISGTTGNSTGPHLHFGTVDPNGRSVDPYGWSGSVTDPLTYNQPQSLWVNLPSLVYYGGRILPSGSPLANPPSPVGGIVIDDTSSGFDETPAGCWTRTSTGSATNGTMRYVRPTLSTATCAATWQPPAGSTPGLYSVYIRIPAIHGTSQGALYILHHADRDDLVVINQLVFPNNFFVSDGWVYAGRYQFNGDGSEYIRLTNRTQDESSSIDSLELAADSVRFVFAGNVTPTPPQIITPTPTSTRAPTRTPTATFTPTITRTPTLTRTPTITRTATVTRTPTLTRTPTRTATASRTPTMTFTPRPTRTPLYYKIKVYFFNRFASRPPFEVAGQRWAKSSAVLTSTLDEYFKGPGAYEKTYYGYVGVYNGFAGYSKLELVDGVAHVYLKGSCQASGSDFTIADLINANLKQYSEVRFVKIYDQYGETRDASGLSDSEPLCLDPFFTPSPTVTATSTVTHTPSRTPTPTNTRPPTRTPTMTRTPRPTSTPVYTLVNVYFVDRRKFEAGTPPYEVAGKRWSLSSAIYRTVLAEYFRGPGATERVALDSGYTGFSNVDVVDGIAHVYLTGTCDHSGGSYTVADLLMANLKQFSAIQYVKIYENGQTQLTEGPADSIPACLEP